MNSDALNRKRSVNRLMLLICFCYILLSAAVPLLLRIEEPMQLILLVIGLQFLVLFLPMYLFMRHYGGVKKFGFVLPENYKLLIYAALLGLGAFFLVTGINNFTLVLWKVVGYDPSGNTELFYLGGGWRYFVALFGVVYTPAFVEEFVFRGGLLNAWIPKGRERAIWHSALLFALLHCQLAFLPGLLVIGLIFATMGAICGSCVPGMVMHGVYNFIVLQIVYMQQHLFSQPEIVEAAAEFTSGVYLANAFFYSLIGIWLCGVIYKKFRATVAQTEASYKLLNPYKPRAWQSLFSQIVEKKENEISGEKTEESKISAEVSDETPIATQEGQERVLAQENLPELTGPEDKTLAQPTKPKGIKWYMGTGKIAVILTYAMLGIINIAAFMSQALLQ